MRAKVPAVVVALVALPLFAGCTADAPATGQPSAEPSSVFDHVENPAAGPATSDEIAICDALSAVRSADREQYLADAIAGEWDGEGDVSAASETYAAVQDQCAEHLTDLYMAERAVNSEHLEEELEAEEPESDPEPVEKAEEPTIEEMYPAAVENCIGVMLDLETYTREDSARQACELALDPSKDYTHALIDQYYTMDPDALS